MENTHKNIVHDYRSALCSTIISDSFLLSMGIEIMKHAFKLLWMVMHLIEEVITYILKSLIVLAMYFNLMYHLINHLVSVMVTKSLKIQKG